MKCPKCGHEQGGTVECAACGLVFEKYRRYLELREQDDLASKSGEPPVRSGGLMRVIGGFGVAVVLLLGGFMLLRGDQAPLGQPQPIAAVDPDAGKSRRADQEARGQVFGLDLVVQLQQSAPPGNPIESVRNATVFLQTPWGEGAGFFIDESCTIITNRHVVKLGEDAIGREEARISALKSQTETVSAMIRSNKDVYEKISRGEARLMDPRLTLEDFRVKIEEDDRRFAEFLREIEAAEQELEQSRWNTRLAIVLADGTRLEGLIDHIADRHDLALVRPLADARCPAVTVGDSEGLRQGDKLFTVGSPMGIRHTVTSGIFSGYLDLRGQPMLQTDAPINPGNSGGPLIDAAGRVVGINTLVMDRAQGIGFAIPIKEAMRSLPVGRN